MSGSAAPAGFHPHASGLLVPEAHARERLVCTADDWRRIERAFKVLNGLGMRMAFRCEKPGCSAIERIAQPDGSTILRCDHADRVFTKAF